MRTRRKPLRKGPPPERKLRTSSGAPAVLASPALWKRAAADLNVSVTELERATVLGQVAGLLIANKDIGRRLAFKGGAVMNLVDGSPRLSGDLDGVVTTSGKVTLAMIKAAFGTPEGRRVVLRIGDIVGQNPQSIDVHFVVCRPLSRSEEITIRIQIGWRFPPLLAPTSHRITLRTGATLELPVLAMRERAAEKVRAFTERGLPRDAFDLHYYAVRVLREQDYKGLARLINRKLQEGDLPDGTNLHTQFEEALRLAATAWSTPRSMTLTTAQPAWSAVEPLLRNRFKALVSQTLVRATGS